MQLDFETCYRALKSKDARFDGRFFTTVKTTGIYCRPICPAPRPRRANIAFVPSSAAAEAQGFRACRRCRPEFAPGSPEWAGSSDLVQRALHSIYAGALNAGSVEDLAEGVGLSSRQLARLFQERVGATPVEVAQSRRTHDARQLLEGTNLPMSDVAHAAGFGSVRSFNAEIRKRFDRTPSELRKLRRKLPSASEASFELRLSYRPPLPWTDCLGYLTARAIRGVEKIDSNSYTRTVQLEGKSGWIKVEPGDSGDTLKLSTNLPPSRAFLGQVETVRSMFDLGCDPQRVASDLSEDPILGPLVQRYPGLRVIGTWDGFELAVRAILGQQVSLAGACTFLSRLVAACGKPMKANLPGLTHCFPTATAAAKADLRGIGLTGARLAALQTLAKKVASGRLALHRGADPELTRAKLLALPGIGDWTAQYIQMRALHDPDAFPSNDLVLRKALFLGGEIPSAAQIRKRAEAWRPWRAYAAMWLWKSTSEKIPDHELQDPR